MTTALRTWLLVAISVGYSWSQQTGPGAMSSGPTMINTVLSGMVMMDDGSPVPGSADIQISCNGSERTVTHTTVNNDFTFQWVRSSQTGSMNSLYNFANTRAGANSDASSMVRPSVPEQSGFCELRASLPGYRSSVINLDDPSEFDGANAGVLWLRPVNAHQGNMVSALSLAAPKQARKLFDDGIKLLHSGKFPEAETSFQKAVIVYPRYADAWLYLGRTQFKMGDNDSATSSLQRSVELDPKLPVAWQVLGYVAFNQKKWNDAAEYLCHAEELDPAGSPTPWFYSAVAYYELRKYDQAEKSIRSEIEMDPQFQNHRARYVLGMILIARHNTTEGSAALRSYLSASPDPRDVVAVQTVLSALPQ